MSTVGIVFLCLHCFCAGGTFFGWAVHKGGAFPALILWLLVTISWLTWLFTK